MEFKEMYLIDCVNDIIDYRGKTPKKLKDNWSEDGDYRAISAKNIKNMNLVNQNSMNKAKASLYKKWMKKEIDKGDILLTSEAPLGETLYWDFEEKIILSQRVFGIKANNEIVNSKYLFAYMQTPFFKHELFARESGTTVTGIRRKELEKVIIKVPSMYIQNYIGQIIYNINYKINNNNKIIANLEELSQTLFKRWFVDFEFPDEDGNPYKSSGGEMIDSELGKIPLNWNVNVLKNIADIRTGYAFKSSEYIYSSKLSVLRTLNISKTSCLIEMNNLKFVSNDYINIPKYNKYSLEIFDTLLVTVGGSIGNIGIITESNLPSLQNQNMWRFRTLNSKINNLLIYNIIKIINKNVSNQTSGSAREFYTKKVFENFKIALPNLNHPMLLKANQIHLNLFKNISNLNKETNNLVKLRDTLLPKLMSGELEISDDIEVNTDELSI
ncbi:restriction endonuclease subunit S [Staphylococcus hominis]|uniref:restriction endonuclease subunit S n=1 Tax=Staphylococcus hominis TaxID=1290 RepID=UPI003DA14C79